LCANYLAASFSFTYSEQVNSNFFHAGRITQIVGKFMQQFGLVRILHELLELPRLDGYLSQADDVVHFVEIYE
jgi:hypothetical protein